ncbi:MAG: hypothetical protein M3503_01090 [Actinomycetota bacterium]|nr:hypothetical protein [Actinomycetota bacterium]
MTMTTSVEAMSPTAAGTREAAPGRGDRRLVWALLALSVLPLVVSAGLLVFDVGASYRAAADWALIEMQIRDIGREPVLTGLYSRSEWSHPGPAQFFLLAPFYWLTGGASFGTWLGALVVNAGALLGMGLVARRRGGTPLLLITILAGSLLVRTLGADFVRDPWNCYMTVLPFGLAVFLAWSLTAGDSWGLPLAVGVTSFVAQAHVGYVVLAVPLLAFGALSLVIRVLRSGGVGQRRSLKRASIVAVAVGGLLWLPPLIDLVLNAPSNAGNLIRYFQTTEDEAHTLVDGWNVISAQLSTLPEWLTWHRTPTALTGEPPSLYGPPLPVLLAVVIAAGALLVKRRIDAGGELVATFAVVVGLGVIAIARTVGLAFDYRLRWTWILGMVAFVIVAWGGWSFVSNRWSRAGRVLGPLTVAVVAVVTGLNVVSALRAGVPYEADSVVLADVMPEVLEAIEGTDGEVLVTDSLAGSWHARGVVLELERRGFAARVPAERKELFGDSRVVGEATPQARIHVGVDSELGPLGGDPNLRLLSEWRSLSPADVAELEARTAEVDADLEAGRIDQVEHELEKAAIERSLNRTDTISFAVATYLDTSLAD